MGEHRRPRTRSSQYGAQLGKQLRQGVIAGLALAGFYCAYSLVLFVIRGDAPFEKNEATLPIVLATYVSSGVAGGVAFGLLHPLTRSLPGRAVLGMLLATLVFFGITVATDGAPWHWGRASWEQTLMLGGLLGLPIGLLWRRFTGL
jgi:hypothetical protein